MEVIVSTYEREHTVNLVHFKEEFHDKVIGLLIENKVAKVEDFKNKDDWWDFEFNVSVLATVTPFIKGRMYMPNGDPGYSDEGGEVHDLEVFIAETKVDLTDYLQGCFEDNVYENLDD